MRLCLKRKSAFVLQVTIYLFALLMNHNHSKNRQSLTNSSSKVTENKLLIYTSGNFRKHKKVQNNYDVFFSKKILLYIFFKHLPDSWHLTHSMKWPCFDETENRSDLFWGFGIKHRWAKARHNEWSKACNF